MTRFRLGWAGVAACWLSITFWVTLRSAPELAARAPQLPWQCILCGDAGLADFLLNLVLFAPLGVASAALRLPRWRTFASALALTIAIESIQRFILVGRDGTLGDVVANSAGALIGWQIYPLLVSISRPTRATARTGIAAVLMLSAGIWVATGIGLRPALSTAAPWFGQLRRKWPGHDLFPGTVGAVTFNQTPVPDDPFSIPRSTGDSVELGVSVARSGAFPVRHTSLVRIVDGHGQLQLSVSSLGPDLFAELRLRATAWGLHTPSWEFRGALTSAAQNTLLKITWQRNQIVMYTLANARPIAEARREPLSIGMGWVFIHPFVRIVASNGRFWDYVWLSWWFGILGWFAGTLGWRVAGLAAATEIGTLLVAAAATGTPGRWDEMLIASLVLALIAAAARRHAGHTADTPAAISSG